MKELLITQPDFMETFSCVGTACREHCCKGQNVTLDRNRYQKYIKSPYAEIKRIAINQISVTQASLASWANIHPDSQGNCPFLDEQRLCQIHKHAGAHALSHSCATFPRVEHVYKNQKIKSMSLSCPEVTRQVLFSDDALTLRFSTINQYDYYKAPDIVIEERLVNRACAAIAASQQPNIEENLWAINCFLQNYQAWDDVNKIKMVEIDNLRTELIATMTAGQAAHELAALKIAPAISDELLNYLADFIAQLADIRGRNTLAAYAQPLLSYATNDLVGQNHNKQQLNNAWQQYALPFFTKHPSVWRNYFMFRIHHDQLAMGDEQAAVTVFNLQAIDFFYLKALISAYASHHGELTEDDVIGIIYSYHACRESTDNSSHIFKQNVIAWVLKEDFSLLSLLA
ncbi:flagellin lysine-N-methylase [Yersinia intermedia]|uniref:flagellin lysine-N-methylase n=1 Tax=Yersinia intermedia TaxID=631 RepID=UPI0005DEC5F8|nr:flagellin lysine-N-methylase [Yersinia intermedia]MCB5322297.1 flagellin lysine-N-methylase [Yersinia intermedia]CQJ64569.1 FliB family protein [Yersinia intermedia]